MTFLCHIPRAFIHRISTCYFEIRKYGRMIAGFWIDSGMLITLRNLVNLTISDAGRPVFGYPLFISFAIQMWLRINTDYVLETTTGIRYSNLNFRNCTPLFLTQDCLWPPHFKTCNKWYVLIRGAQSFHKSCSHLSSLVAGRVTCSKFSNEAKEQNLVTTLTWLPGCLHLLL